MDEDAAISNKEASLVLEEQQRVSIAISKDEAEMAVQLTDYFQKQRSVYDEL